MSERKIVLVVDDDESMRDAVHRMLNETGFPNATYASAEELIAGGRFGEAFLPDQRFQTAVDVRARAVE